MNKNLEITKQLVGETITEANLTFVDSYVNQNLSIYVPIGGSCGYAVTPRHTHPSYMFVVPYDDESSIVIDGIETETPANSLLCLSPNIKHSEIQNYLPPKYSAIFINKEYFENYFKSYREEKPFFNGLIIELKDSKLDNYIKDFIIEVENDFISMKTVLDSLSVLITNQIIRTIIDDTIEVRKYSNNISLSEPVKYMNTHFEEDITVEFLSSLSQLSKSHFTKIFTKEMSISPIEYLKIIRLQNAKKLLFKTQLSITEISTKCGFNSPSYFTKLFKENYNETPKEFTLRVK